MKQRTRSGGSQPVARASQRETSGTSRKRRPLVRIGTRPSPRSEATPSLRRQKQILILSSVLLPAISFASDHNNLESGHPLRFEDATSLAFGERSFTTGFQLSGSKGTKPASEWMADFGYGFAKNQDLSLSIDKTFNASPSVVAASYFVSFTRQVGDKPAFAMRAGVHDGGNQLSLIATKTLHQYDRVHLNVDLDSTASPLILLGYSTPLGYPKGFDRTFVGELGLQRNVLSAGAGLRLQTGPTSVFDLGLTGQFDLSAAVRLSVGYSVSF